MVTATDVITYIGIPLVVLGVMPILWNAGKSWFLRRRLCAIIPRFVKHEFFTIIVDLASGTVSVRVKQLYINARSFFGYDPVSLNALVEQPNFLPIEPSSVTTAELEAGENRQRSFAFRGRCGLKVRRPKATLLSSITIRDVRPPAASWMPLIDAGMMPFNTRGASPNRYTVDSDFVCPETTLSCKWPTFVYLALALGASPWEISTRFGEARSRATYLHDIKGEPLMKIMLWGSGILGCRFQSGEKTLSLRRMLAWENIMLSKVNNRWTCVPVPSYESETASIPLKRLWPISDIQDFSLDGLVMRGIGHENDGQNFYTHRREKYRKKDRRNKTNFYSRNWSPELFEDALCWTIYAEDVYGSNTEILPVSQPFLVMQEHSVVKLGRWDPEKRRKLLQAIFPDAKLVDKILADLDSACAEPIDFGRSVRRSTNLTVLSDADSIRNALPPETSYMKEIGDFHESRKGRPFNDGLVGSRAIWKNIKANSEFMHLRNSFEELCKGSRSQLLEGPRGNNGFRSEEAEFIAHLLLAFSVTKAWVQLESKLVSYPYTL
ncbi:hypothetical protein RU639_013810 [Aspergillus parasiticus]